MTIFYKVWLFHNSIRSDCLWCELFVCLLVINLTNLVLLQILLFLHTLTLHSLLSHFFSREALIYQHSLTIVTMIIEIAGLPLYLCIPLFIPFPQQSVEKGQCWRTVECDNQENQMVVLVFVYVWWWWWEFDKIPVTLSERLKTFFYFRSWRGQMHREELMWKHCKWKLIGSGKEGETVNLGPNGCKNKWICANSEVVSWLPKQMRYCKDMLGVDEEFDVCNFSCWHLDDFVNIFDRINQILWWIFI